MSLSDEPRPLLRPLPDPAVLFRTSPTLLQVSGAARPSGPICGPGSSRLPAVFLGSKNTSSSSSQRPPPSSGRFPQHQVTGASPRYPNLPPPPPSSGTGPAPSASSFSPPTTPSELHCACATDADALRRSGQWSFRFQPALVGRPASRGKGASGLPEISR